MPHVTATEVERVLREALPPLQSIEVIDDSHLHAGHAGAREGSHLRVRIVGDCMAGLGPAPRDPPGHSRAGHRGAHPAGNCRGTG
jgi:stress-induced morphogen